MRGRSGGSLSCVAHLLADLAGLRLLAHVDPLSALHSMKNELRVRSLNNRTDDALKSRLLGIRSGTYLGFKFPER
jgi:hypothetical protein